MRKKRKMLQKSNAVMGLFAPCVINPAIPG
jgi:hypothetical protein